MNAEHHARFQVNGPLQVTAVIFTVILLQNSTSPLCPIRPKPLL